MAFPGNTLIDVLRDVWTGGSGTGKLRVDATVTPSGTTDANIIQIGGASVTLGQKTMANSFPVVFASDQSSLNINNISGTITLPTGAATETTLAALNAKIPSAIAAADDITPSSSPTLIGLLYGYDQASGNWDRWRMVGDSSDSLGTASTGHMQVMSHNLLFNGTTWDRVRGDITNGIDVDVTRVQGSVTIEQATAANLNATVAQSGIWTVQPGNTANTTPWLVSTKSALTASSPTFATVGITSASAVAANSSRKGLVLINTSNNTISLGLGATAVLSSGITLTPGGVWEMDENTFTTAAINAIASAASSNLAIQEYT